MARNKVEEKKQDMSEKSLEENMEQLKEYVRLLESDELSLDESFQMYQLGMELVKCCNNQIDMVEKKVLTLKDDGSLEDF